VLGRGRKPSPVPVADATVPAPADWVPAPASRAASPAGRVPGPRPVSDPGGDLVERGELQARLRDLLLDDGSEPVIGIHGTAGFGKTTLAEQVARLPEVRARFPGGLLRATVGQQATGPALAALIGDLVARLTGEPSAVVTPAQAGQRLATELNHRPPALLVIDDVWTREQLVPFLAVGGTSRLMITSRVRGLLPEVPLIVVGEMTHDEATALLLRGLPGLPRPDLTALLALAGRWPLLLTLVNGVLRERRAPHALIDQLGADGTVTLDSAVPAERDRAVDRAVRAALDLLPDPDRRRFLELGIFPEGGTIPDRISDLLWSGTGGLTSAEAADLRTALARLGLVRKVGGGTRLHDVLRAYVRNSLPDTELPQVNRRLVEMARPRSGGPWWMLPQTDRYLWRHLAFHLREARWWDELFTVVTDLRRLAEGIPMLGVAAMVADLDRVPDPRAAALRARLSRAAHLLRPIRPAGAFADVLLSRLAGAPELAAEVAEFGAALRSSAGLVARRPLPDVGPDSLRRMIAGGAGWLDCGAISPDGSWLAAAGASGVVSLFEPGTGMVLGRLTGHAGGVKTLAATRDRLVSGGADGTLRVWDVNRRSLDQVLWRVATEVLGCAVAPSGRRIAAVSGRGELAVFDRGVRVFGWWGPADRLIGCVFVGEERVLTVSPDGVITDHDLGSGLSSPLITPTAPTAEPAGPPAGSRAESAVAVAVGSAGEWVALSRSSGEIEIHPLRGEGPPVILRGHQGCVSTLVASGDRVISGGEDGTVRVWDRYGPEVAVVRAHPGWVTSCLLTPDRRTLITTGSDATIRVWDLPRLVQETVAGPIDWLNTCAVAPSGAELITGGRDGVVRLRRPADAGPAPIWTGRSPVTRCGFGPEGDWIVAVCGAQAVVLRQAGDGWASEVLPGSGDCATAPDQDLVARWDTQGGLEIRSVAATRPASPARRTAPATPSFFWRTHHRPIRAAVFLPGNRLLAADDAGTLTVWRYRSDRTRTVPGRRRESPERGLVRAIQVVRDRVVVVDAFGVQIFAVRRMRPLAAAELPDSPVTHGAVSPDGHWLATTDDTGELRIWPLPAPGIDELRPVAAMRVDGALFECAWAPGSLDLHAAGQRGEYAFTFRPPRPGCQEPVSPAPKISWWRACMPWSRPYPGRSGGQEPVSSASAASKIS
jgi:WD40 repeat protein